ncbi:MAG TPA: hypothetical protein VH619_03325 [Verrucomicrobiae bacterium]|nr:hypothetical protein [Verrucomicrobiae bacterium]
MANNREHIERIQLTVEHLHRCKAHHCATIPVHEVFRGQTVWKGDVEEFTLTGHPKATTAYGWTEGEGAKERFFAVLELPPIKSALDAVRASIVADSKKKN